MSDERREMDERIRDPRTIERIAQDLGLKSQGKHFFCPSCHDAEAPMVIKDGRFECFRCGVRGDVVGLVKLARKCDLEAALEWLSGEIEP
ncbi:CHC2 zinc finger domain-containing protein [Geoalkalibacter halelectricus]|uniref:CHC2 zinc finger domain-containing protein n=1 Tax=Geoalkalibacter halelectricus TaxID=2847045 RepID=A0ABY5ZNY3_9BACT|nr:CHC2 zinc finger domain-containing protein [Geoalkalibacter halelectricus]MDO3379914.1 CHC2 zinc finger domain-containing protein [Geoalkalibacter halelectricus]UWZ80559.1 CHC2 zinc finger domain-containing protein [Geoalkalibacter halelectricus]